MNRYVTLTASVVAAGALVGSVLTEALASSPPFRDAASSKVKHYNIKGALTITNVLRVNKNFSDYGKVYAHGGQQVWKGLLVHSGGVNTNSLSVSGTLQAASGTVGGVTLQGGSINGTSLTTTGDGHVGGALAVSGKVTSNGLDAGAGGVTTTGAINGGALTASSVNDSGQLSAGSITTSGALTANSISTNGTVQANSLKVTSGVDFTGANVTGLTLGNLNLNNSTVQGFTVTNSLTAGSTSLTTGSPLTLQQNGQTAGLGVNTSGAVTAPALAVSGSSGITAPILQSASSTSQLTLQGAPVVIKGATTLSNNTTLANSSDLALSVASGSGTASHIVASGDTDVAGNLSETISSGSAAGSDHPVSYTFIKSYGSTPIVVVTPTSDPTQTSTAQAKYWVSTTSSGFTIHYEPAAATTADYTIHFSYFVIGQ